MTIDINSYDKDIGLIVRNAIRNDSYFINYAYLGKSETVANGSITSGTNSLLVDDISRLDIGDRISISGAGSNDTRLVSIVTAISGTTVTIQDNASTTVSDKGVNKFDSETTSSKDVNQWIFLLRPDQEGQSKGLSAGVVDHPRVYVEIIDSSPEEEVTHSGEVETATLAIIHVFVDKKNAQPLDPLDFITNTKRIIRALRDNESDIFKSSVVSGFTTANEENGRIEEHIQVRGLIKFREAC